MQRGVRRTPTEYLSPFERAVEDVVKQKSPAYLKEGESVRVGFEGQFGFHRVSPRELLSPFLGTLVQVEGIVTKCSVVRPKLVKSAHYIKAKDELMFREYRDMTSFDGPATGASYPTQDADGNKLETEFGRCVYKDHQSLVIQEMPENAPPGQLPRSVEVVVEEDLVDKSKPGDRVQIVGIYRPVGSKSGNAGSGIYRTLLVGNSIKTIGRNRGSKAALTAADIRLMRQVVKRNDALAYMGESLAPSICGHQDVKEAILLLLAGGVEKTLENKTHLRGDVNMLMVGDPSVAKSQLLRCVMNISPLAVSTTGRGSSGVGLTAAVTTDQETGDRQLEAGAMVLADRGVVCIDEFDKMSDMDRVAIHETMEQQTVTIAKAGIHTTLNARCSVVAAANPVYGTYDTSRSMMENVGLPDSLLSRFDLLFILLDKMDPELDARIGEHVLRMHRFRGKGVGGAAVAAMEDDADAEEEESAYAPYDALLHGKRRSGRQQLLSTAFLRKMINYTKERFEPQLTEEASEIIANKYTELRQNGGNSSLPITARTLETMVRLATAHARLMQRKKVSTRDATVATELLARAIGGEAAAAEERAGGSGRGGANGKSSGGSGEGGADGGDGAGGARRGGEAGADGSGKDAAAAAEEEPEVPEAQPGAEALEKAQAIAGKLSEAQTDMLEKAIALHFKHLEEAGGDEGAQTTVGAIAAATNAALPATPFTLEQVFAYLRTMDSSGRIMLVGHDDDSVATEDVEVHLV